MRALIAILSILLGSTSVSSVTVDRAFEISVDGGVLWTDNLVDLEPGGRFASTITLRQHVVRQGGYFVDVILGHGVRSDLKVNPVRFEDVSSLAATGAFGLFARYRRGKTSLDYRVGYGIVGDGLYYSHFILNGMTLTRGIRGKAFLRVDGKWLKSTRRGSGLMTGLGIGFRL